MLRVNVLAFNMALPFKVRLGLLNGFIRSVNIVYYINTLCQHLFFINISIVNQVMLGFYYEYFCVCTGCDTVGYIYLYKNNIIIVIMVIVYSVLYCIHIAVLVNTGLYTILRSQGNYGVWVWVSFYLSLPCT